MSSAKFLVIAIFACAACVVVAKPTSMAFDIARNHTVCRTKIEYDENVDRIPKIIKMLKCEDDPYEMCPASNGKSMPCCGALDGAAKFSCTEVLDIVMVKNANTMKDEVINVAIGCSCIQQNPNKAKDPTPDSALD